MVERARLENKLDEVAKYAKSVSIQAKVVESLIASYANTCDPRILDFARICSRVYKALCLWTILKDFYSRLKSQKFNQGENFNQVAAICVSLAGGITMLMKDLDVNQQLRESQYYCLVDIYVGKMISPLWKE